MTESILFIDANRYLNLFGIPTGKKLLDLLDEQKAHVFITGQIVDEVLRNKLRLAERFFTEILKEYAEVKVAVPDHLLGIEDTRLKELRKTFKDAEEARSAIHNLAIEVLRTISQSTDAVSQRLRPLFEQAIERNAEELSRARERRERGNPPGKPNDPLGDQISWEQLLTRCHDTRPRAVWIITADKDYHTKSERKLFLNPLLNRDLIAACGVQPDVHCFDDLLVGLTEFAKSVGVSEERLPTADEAKQIRKEADNWIATTTPVSVLTNSAWTSDELIPSLKRQEASPKLLVVGWTTSDELAASVKRQEAGAKFVVAKPTMDEGQK